MNVGAKLSRVMSDSVRYAIIGHTLKTDEGIRALGLAMIEPILISMDYRSYLRKVLDNGEIDFDMLPDDIIAKNHDIGMRYLSLAGDTPELVDEPYPIDLRFIVGLATDESISFRLIDDGQSSAAAELIHRENMVLRHLVMVLPTISWHMDSSTPWSEIETVMSDDGHSIDIISNHGPLDGFGYEHRMHNRDYILSGMIGLVNDAKIPIPVYDMGIPGMVVFPPRRHVGRLYHRVSPSIELERSDGHITLAVEERIFVAIEATAKILRTN